jgi:endo-1,4-beta-D-glucanase Y
MRSADGDEVGTGAVRDTGERPGGHTPDRIRTAAGRDDRHRTGRRHVPPRTAAPTGRDTGGGAGRGAAGRCLAIAGILVAALLGTACTPAGGPGAEPPSDGVAAATVAAQAFLDTYVEADGRVVRRDEGGDTVSEGQAYALLIAAAIGEQDRFDAVWSWTRANLMRSDGLLSWRWADGSVADPNSAADADLDTARALVIAGQRFADPTHTSAGLALAAAVLDASTTSVGTEAAEGAAGSGGPGDTGDAGDAGPPTTGTAVEGAGLVLTGGNWSRTPPATVNPSYFSPRAEELLGTVTGDPRWADLSRTHRALAWQLVGTGLLPPDWVEVDSRGTATPTADPAGRPPRFSLDAARLPVRMAESCDPEDRALAAELRRHLDVGDEEVPGAYGLDGTPQVSWSHPLSLVAVAAAAEAAGDEEQSDARLRAAAELDRRAPTYYGSAWAALGWIMLDTDLLGSCP